MPSNYHVLYMDENSRPQYFLDQHGHKIVWVDQKKDATAVSLPLAEKLCAEFQQRSIAASFEPARKTEQ